MKTFQLDLAQVEHEARAKIFWGDEPQEVVKYLRMQGIGLEEASMLVDSMFEERVQTIRSLGLRKLLVGFSLLSVPVISWIIFNIIGFIETKLFGLAVMVGLWGGYLVAKGGIMFSAPRSEPGDVADQ